MKYFHSRLPLLFFASIAFVLIFSCQNNKKKPHYQVDISAIEIDKVSVGRYEEVLFNLNPFTLGQDIKPYIDRFYVFLGEAINTEEGQEQLFEYVTDPQARELYLDTREVWPVVTALENELTQAFRYYKFHFPEQDLPQVFTYVSGLDFNFPVKYHENVLVIGLDLYLGHNYHLYPKVGVPAYQTFTMQPPFAVIDVMKIIGEKHLQQSVSVPESFLDFMIYEGKLRYFLDCMLPAYHDTLKIAYTSDQLNWLQKNEGRVWAYFLENEMLYSSERQTIIKFIGDAPFTAPFSRNAPPRTASFIGWQIVREFMKKNPDFSLKDLLNEKDSQKILSRSGYRPR
jgi:hypothetical protein